MIRFRSLNLVLACVCAAMCSAEELPAPPTDEQLKQALERGRQVREQKSIVPEALMKSAVLLKAGNERCGHALVRIEDAKGSGGAVYRMIENLKVCMPQGNDLETVEYTGDLLLAADLTLMSGKQASTRTVVSGKTSAVETVVAEITVDGGELKWARKEKSGDDPQTISEPEAHKLHGVRPVPRNAVIALAAFASKEGGFMPGISSPFMVPTLDMGTTIDTFLIQPAWLSFELPKDKKDPNVKMNMAVRYLDAEIDEKGMKVEPPAAETFADTMSWTFDKNLRILAQPSAGETMIQVETTDPDKLNPDEALNFAQIRIEVKKLEDKANKEAMDRITKVPLK